MKIPFFTSSRTQQTNVLVRPPRPPAYSSEPAQTECDIQDTDRPQGRTQTTTMPEPNMSANGPAVSLSINSILSQLPSRLFVPGTESQLANAVVAIPIEW